MAGDVGFELKYGGGGFSHLKFGSGGSGGDGGGGGRSAVGRTDCSCGLTAAGFLFVYYVFLGVMDLYFKVVKDKLLRMYS